MPGGFVLSLLRLHLHLSGEEDLRLFSILTNPFFRHVVVVTATLNEDLQLRLFSIPHFHAL
jgi:hypothetical protein